MKDLQSLQKELEKYITVVSNDDLPDLRNDPTVLKRREEARAFLEKHPIPEEWFNENPEDHNNNNG